MWILNLFKKQTPEKFREEYYIHLKKYVQEVSKKKTYRSAYLCKAFSKKYWENLFPNMIIKKKFSKIDWKTLPEVLELQNDDLILERHRGTLKCDQTMFYSNTDRILFFTKMYKVSKKKKCNVKTTK